MSKLELINAVICRVFRQADGSVSCEHGFCNPVCISRDVCCVSEKSEHQLSYVMSSIKENIFVDACPGSGKTEIVALKAAYEYQEWQARNKGIAILTFTNNAADVITQRVTQYAGIAKSGYPHFVGTLDSWLHQYIAQPFAHLLTGYAGKGFDRSIRLVEEASTSEWLTAFKCEFPYFTRTAGKPKQIPRYANMLRYDLEKQEWDLQTAIGNTYLSIGDYFNSSEFQSFYKVHPNWSIDVLRQKCTEAKSRFLRAGFATYDDIELLSYRLLAKNDLADKLAGRFPLLIVDECQDLSFCQLKILGRLRQAGAVLHFVGDLNQAIYEFRKVDPQRVNSFVQVYNFQRMLLPDNFRSSQHIIDLCAKLIGTSHVRGQHSTIAGNACFCFRYKDADELPAIPIRFARYLEGRSISVRSAVILARGRGTVAKLQALHPQKQHSHLTMRLALAILLWKKQDSSHWDESLKNLGDFISSRCFKRSRGSFQNYYCPSVVNSPARWRMFLARTLQECSKFELGNLNKTWTSWVKCANDTFLEIANRYRESICAELSPFQRINIKSPNGFAAKNVESSLSKPQTSDCGIKISTIHGVKGQTFDAILLVSPKSKGQGGHWKEWLADQSEEPARFAYVASSRPRKLLAWAIHAPSSDDENALRALGFDLEQLPV